MSDQQEHRLNDLPDYDGIEDEGFPPLPPPHSPGRGGQEDGDPFGDAEDGDVSGLADVPAAKRKGAKRPQPKLDSHRLISERGLPALRTLFENVHFKGKGHEAQNLRLLMQRMENWAHRLYPKLQFEDFVDKVEKLGAKKDVQTCLKRIRLDMPLTHEDFMDEDGEAQAPPELQVFGDPDPFGGESVADDLQGPVHSTPAAPSLTEEQRRRMELNRRRALDRKLARRQHQPTGPSDSQTVVTSSPGIEPTDVLDRGETAEDLDPEPAAGSQQPSRPLPEPAGGESSPDPGRPISSHAED